MTLIRSKPCYCCHRFQSCSSCSLLQLLAEELTSWIIAWEYHFWIVIYRIFVRYLWRHLVFGRPIKLFSYLLYEWLILPESRSYLHPWLMDLVLTLSFGSKRMFRSPLYYHIVRMLQAQSWADHWEHFSAAIGSIRMIKVSGRSSWLELSPSLTLISL